MMQPAGAALVGSSRDRAGEHRHPALGEAVRITHCCVDDETADTHRLARMPIRSSMSALVRSPSPLMTMMSPVARDLGAATRDRGRVWKEDDGSICPGGFATSSCWWWAAVARCGLCAGSERSVTAPRSGICARSSFVRGRSDCCGESGDLLRRPSRGRSLPSITTR